MIKIKKKISHACIYFYKNFRTKGKNTGKCEKQTDYYIIIISILFMFILIKGKKNGKTIMRSSISCTN